MIFRFQIVPEPQNGLGCCQRSCLALFAAHQPARLAKILAEGHEHKFKIKDAGLNSLPGTAAEGFAIATAWKAV